MVHLDLSREQILAFRRRVGELDERLPRRAESLRRAAWAGLQDSMPRAAVLSVHSRVEGTGPMAWEDPAYVQVWGPRYSAYVVPKQDIAPFTLGRLPDSEKGRRRAREAADRLEALLEGESMPYNEAGKALGVNANSLRYGATTGRLLIRWDGARKPAVWTIPPPDVEPYDARLELARRFLHMLGPATPRSFTSWAGLPKSAGAAAFEALGDELIPVRTPIGDAWMLAADESEARAVSGSPAPARLLPSGDAFYLLEGSDRELLVPEAEHRDLLWTARVWPGALLVGGEVAGVWRRRQHLVTIEPWRPLSREERDAVEEEAASLPLPGLDAPIDVAWVD